MLIRRVVKLPHQVSILHFIRELVLLVHQISYHVLSLVLLSALLSALLVGELSALRDEFDGLFQADIIRIRLVVAVLGDLPNQLLIVLVLYRLVCVKLLLPLLLLPADHFFRSL